MKLNEMTSAGNEKAYRKGRGPGSGKARLPAVVTRARTLVQAAV